MNNLGILSKDPDGYRVVFERIYNHDVQTVWDALTDPEKMKHWFTDVRWDFVPGGKITFIFQDSAKTESFGRIVAIAPGRLLEFIWENEDGGPDELARWELFDEGSRKTRLLLTYSRLTDDLAVNVSTGWHVVLDDFEAFLEGRTDFPAFGAEGLNDEGKAIKEQYSDVFNQNFSK